MPDKQTTDAWTVIDVIGQQNKRLFILAMALLIAWMTTIGVFLWYLHEYDFESYSYTHAKTADERNRYIEMSRDELKHAANIAQMADMVAAGSNDESTHIAWKALRMHIEDWSDRIREKLDRAAKK